MREQQLQRGHLPLATCFGSLPQDGVPLDEAEARTVRSPDDLNGERRALVHVCVGT